MYCQLITLVILQLHVTSASGNVYYITPSQNIPCPQLPCLTLSHLAACNLKNGSNVTRFLFLPGNHTLDSKLLLTDADSVSVTTINGEAAVVECTRQIGGFQISRIITVFLWSLHFVGCGGNIVSHVDHLTLEDITFQGMEGSGTALVLSGIPEANILRCSFLHNTNGTTVQGARVPTFGGCTPLTSTVSEGGAMIATNSNVWVHNTTFEGNQADLGAAIFVEREGNVSITHGHFFDNKASVGGLGVLYVDYNCNLQVNMSTFNNNLAGLGMISSLVGTVAIANSMFMSNTAMCYGGSVFAFNSLVSISQSTYSNNTAKIGAGVISSSGSLFHIVENVFSNNIAQQGGVMFTFEDIFNIADNIFTNNMAVNGGVLFTTRGRFLIADSNFSNNNAVSGGVMSTSRDTFLIVNSTFNGNSALLGGIVYSFNTRINASDCNFEKTVSSIIGTMYLFLSPVYFSGNTVFTDNVGSLTTFNANITFSGISTFNNCTEPPNKEVSTLQEGGAITSILSSIIFVDESLLTNNQARYGGALLAIESVVSVSGETTIANNTATDGGGISLSQSHLEILDGVEITFSVLSNSAMRGGGIYSIDSTIAVRQPSTLHLTSNDAHDGGGLYLTGYTKINFFKLVNDNFTYPALLFTANHANSGGAIYVDDETNSAACSTKTECIIQSLSLDPQILSTDNTVNIYFFNNMATESGSDIYGGLFNRCIQSQIAAVPERNNTGLAYLEQISNITLNSIASLPVKVCLCNDRSQPDCSHHQQRVQVRKGEKFTVLLAAVDQAEHLVGADINSFLSSFQGRFSEGQQTQRVEMECKNLMFNVFSPENFELLTLYADGPCGSSEFSVRYVNITFLDCTCPIGFEPGNSPTSCECICDSALSRYITTCDSSTNSLLRVNTNSWITYINDTNPSDYLIYPTCPFDYCHSPTDNISINLNLPNGQDAQCAYNRTGVLCGACKEHLSLSLGSSLCLPCSGYWPAVLVAILLAAIIAGILLVTAVLVLNFTVAIGLINGFIFYADVVAAGNSVLFSSSEPSFPTVFVTWLNLDIGLNVCFIDGLDAYTKTWLQFAFPVYIITLVGLVIAASQYSSRFAKLIGKKDPIAALATLILLSYAKLLSTTLAVLSFATLNFPDGSKSVVWFVDGNVKYFQGKHLALVIVALLIIIVGVPYTILLFLWHWLVRAPNWKIFRWTRNSRLNGFITTYHVPYSSKHRYWTGLLLIVRVVLYTVTASTASDNPQVTLLTIIVLVGSLFLLKGIVGRVYRLFLNDVLEMVIYFNLLTFAAFSLFEFKANSTMQVAIAHISTLTTVILLFGVIVFSTVLLLKKRTVSSKEMDVRPITPTEISNPTHSEIVFSNVDIPYFSPTSS